MPGGRVTRLAVLGALVVLAVDLAITGRLSAIFDVGFVLVCLGAALAVHPRDFFGVGVLPPLLLLGFITLAALVNRAWVADTGDGLVQAVVSGLADRATGLLAAYLLALAVLVIRQRVLAARSRSNRSHSNRDGSPAPTLATTGGPSDRSTTVVGSDPHSPESSTASTQ